MNKKLTFDLLAVVGPTASGKTAVSIELARRLGGEIISADSMAVYRHMNVGTAKPDESEQKQAVFHLIDVAEPDELYNAGMFEEAAAAAIEQIRKKERLPIICGGSGLYVQAAVRGLESEIPVCDPGIRALVNRVYERMGNDYLCRVLEKADPESYAATDLKNPRRVSRLLEIWKQTGLPPSVVFRRENQKAARYRTISFGLNMSRQALHKRIEARTDIMLANGLEQEARMLLERGSVTALQAIGYKEMADYISGRYTLEEASEYIKAATRQLAKRQCSWFRRDKNIIWIDVEDLSVSEAADQIERRLIIESGL